MCEDCLSLVELVVQWPYIYERPCWDSGPSKGCGSLKHLKGLGGMYYA
jgi:hypothetical protein